MLSRKFTCSLLLSIVHSMLINAQIGGFNVPQSFGIPRPFLNAGGSAGSFSNQATNFQQNRGGSFGLAAFGSSGSSTNFQQQSSNGAFNNGFLNRGLLFRNENDALNENEMSQFRYASPYDTVQYVPHKILHKPAYAAAPPPPAYSAPVQCPQNLLVGCAPQVQYVPCQPPPPSY